MSVIYVPYHLDEHLPTLNVPLPGPAEVITPVLPEADVWTRLAALYRPLAAAVGRVATTGARPAVVSGDCTVSLAVVAGIQATGAAPGIVWFDAHGDVQTLETTETGYLGGLPLRLLTGYQPALIADHLSLAPIPESAMVLVDARDLDQAEIDYLATAQIRRTTVTDLTAAVVPAGPVILHIDLDVITPTELPGLRVPAPGGPTAAQVLAAAHRVLATGQVIALDIACTWLPDTAPTPTRAEVLADLLA